MQCSPDLSEMDCSNCLVVAQEYIQGCCSGNSGLRILAPSCNLRIETDQFYDSTLVQSPPSLSPPPPPPLPPPPSKGTFPKRTSSELFFYMCIISYSLDDY